MNYRRLGKTGLHVSVAGIGTWQYCGDWGKTFTADEVRAILEHGREAGINLLDTAECYGDHVSELLVGEALASRRGEWVISTKFGHGYDPKNGAKYTDFSAAGVQRQLEASLRALRTDYVDIYLFHSGDNRALDNPELWTMLDKQKKAGKIAHYGVSLHPDPTDNIYQTTKAAEYGAEVIEVLYNRLERLAEDGVFYLCRENDIGVIGRVPLSSGYLSGKYHPGSTFPSNDVRENYHTRAQREEKLSRAEIIGRHEVPKGTDMAVWAMGWCLQNPAVAAFIGGYKSASQLDSAIGAAQTASRDHPLAVPEG